MADESTGLWLIGARGSVATTAVGGLLALRAGLAPPTGCVTERPELAGVALPGVVATSSSAGTTSRDTRWRSGPSSWPTAACCRTACWGASRSGLRAADARDPARRRPVDRRQPGRRRPAAGRRHRRVPRAARPRPGRRGQRVLHRAARAAAAGARRPGRAGARRWPTGTRRCCRPARWPPTRRSRAGCPFVDFTPSTGVALPALDELARRERPAVRRARRQDRRDPAQDGARADVRRAGAARAVVGGHQPARRRRRRHPGRPGARRQQAASPRRAGSRRCSASEVTAPLHIDYVPDLGELEDRLGPRLVRGLPRRADAPAVHLDGLRLGAGRAAGARPGPADRRGARGGRVGRAGRAGFFFKDPLGSDEHRLRRADPRRCTSGRASWDEGVTWNWSGRRPR